MMKMRKGETMRPIKEILEGCEDVFDGPWTTTAGDISTGISEVVLTKIGGAHCMVASVDPECAWQVPAATATTLFIANSRQDIPEMAETIVQLRKELEVLKVILEEQRIMVFDA